MLRCTLDCGSWCLVSGTAAEPAGFCLSSGVFFLRCQHHPSLLWTDAGLEKRCSVRERSCSSGRFGRVSQERVLSDPPSQVLLLEVCSGISTVVYVVIAFPKAEKEIRNSYS